MPAPNEARVKSYAGDMMREGRAGESVVASLLPRLFVGQPIRDVRDDSAYRAQDVDYLAGATRIEIKSDTRVSQTGNLLFEFARFDLRVGDFRIGWSVFSAADFLMVWCAPAQTVYAAPMRAFRDGLTRYVRQQRGARVVSIQTDAERITYGIPVPLTFVRPLQVYVFHNGSVTPTYFPAAS